MLNLDTEHELYALSEEECLEEEPVRSGGGAGITSFIGVREHALGLPIGLSYVEINRLVFCVGV